MKRNALRRLCAVLALCMTGSLCACGAQADTNADTVQTAPQTDAVLPAVTKATAAPSIRT